MSSYNKISVGKQASADDHYKRTVARIEGIQGHLLTAPRSQRLKDKVCIITGVGSLKGIGSVALLQNKNIVLMCHFARQARCSRPLRTRGRSAPVLPRFCGGKPSWPEGDHREDVSRRTSHYASGRRRRRGCHQRGLPESAKGGRSAGRLLCKRKRDDRRSCNLSTPRSDKGLTCSFLGRNSRRAL
jgi:hypothetical protein